MACFRFVFLSVFVPSNSMQVHEMLSSTSDHLQLPYPVPYWNEPRRFTWSLCASNSVGHSNLGGLGPDGGPQELRWESVLQDTEGRVTYDLVVTNLTEYRAANTSKNGNYYGDCVGNINVESPSEVEIQFQFMAHGTNYPVSFSFNDYVAHNFTVYDIDESRSGMRETIEFGTEVATVWYTHDHTLDRVNDNPLTFTSTEVGIITDNPDNPSELTLEQQNRAVLVDYYSKSVWKITFRAEGNDPNPGRGGRNFLFSAHSFLGPGAEEYHCQGGSCEVWADPHVSGFDNPAKGPVSLIGGYTKTFDRQPVDVNAYETGDFWLVKNADIQIQARYAKSQEFRGDRAAVGALAIGGPFIGSTLLVEPKNGAVMWGGVRLAENSKHELGNASAPVSVQMYYNAIHEGRTAPSGVDVSLPLGLSLKIQRYNSHLDLKINAAKRLHAVDGQCGNFNGNPRDDTLEHINNRMQDMTVARRDSLFLS